MLKAYAQYCLLLTMKNQRWKSNSKDRKHFCGENKVESNV